MSDTSLAENKALVRRYWEELWNVGDLAVADAIIAPDFVAPMPPPNQPLHGPADVRAFAAADRAAFPDLHFIVEDVIAENDRVVTRWTMRGTHRGTWKDFAPTGRPVAFTGITTFTIAAGKIAGFQVNSDAFGVLQQIGVINP